MPCQSEPSGYANVDFRGQLIPDASPDYVRDIKPLERAVDRLTHENDVLREVVLQLADSLHGSPEAISGMESLRTMQTDHRREDLDRLERTLTTPHLYAEFELTPDVRRDMVRKVIQADPTKPLEPQLGFDPDAY